MKNITDTNQFRFSPSDLILYMRSPFASWVEHFIQQFPEEADSIHPDVDPFMDLMAEQGNRHEREFLNQLIDLFGESNVCLINEIDLDAATSQTLEALRKGYAVIYQATLQRDNFLGKADFLVRREGSSKLGSWYYEPWDTKLSKITRPYYLVQLCCYSWMLESIQGVWPEHIAVILNDFSEDVYRTKSFQAYFKVLKSSFLEFHDVFSRDDMPDPAYETEFGRWSGYAETLKTQSDSLAQVANIKKSQVRKIHEVGIATMSELAKTDVEKIAGLETPAFKKLKAQAAIQKESKAQNTPQYQVFKEDKGKGLSALPPVSGNDVYLKIEGHPTIQGGIEYLWGVGFSKVEHQQELEYKDWWGHSSDQEKKAISGVIDWIYQRWQADPAMHIFHYGSRELTAVRKLSSRYNVKGKEIRDLLVHDVFVDLSKIVKNGVLIGEPRYTLQHLEHFYASHRSASGHSDADSAIEYERWYESEEYNRWVATGFQQWDEQPDMFHWESWERLNIIRDYNRNDCESLVHLGQWLRGEMDENHISYSPKSDTTEEEKELTDRQIRNSEIRQELEDRRQALRNQFENDESLKNDPVAELLIQLIDFFIRESKPKNWEYYDRLDKDSEELVDDDTAIVGVSLKSHEYEEYKVVLKCSYDKTQPVRKDKFASGTLLEHDLTGDVTFINDPSISHDLEIRLDTFQVEGQFLEPFTLIGSPLRISTIKMENRICAIAEEYFETRQLRGILDTIFHRRNPSYRDSETELLPITRKCYPDNSEYLQAIINNVKHLDQSSACIQGPPGAGKTYTAKYVIKTLLEDGKRVGIMSNSHAAIMNLMEPVLDLFEETMSSIDVVKVGGLGRNKKEFEEKYPQDKAHRFTYRTSFSFTKKAPYANFNLIGATAYGFCNDEAWNHPLDYLFIDEASQVSLPYLMAVSGATENLVLMGDQMQLKQPIQGDHPGEAGKSILEYYLGDHSVIPDDMGIFLERTYRMHPEVCQPLSDAVYESKLYADQINIHQKITLPDPGIIHQQKGILWLPVDHNSNRHSSIEEVSLVEGIIGNLMTGTHTDKHGIEHPFTHEDVLVIAPFNLQVQLLKEKLGEEIKVGTIDKFQGQEAPVVIISMGVSDVSESSRGLDFVFDINRLNVAVSRAKALAIIVSSQTLYQCRVNSVEQMERVNFFCSLIEHSHKNL